MPKSLEQIAFETGIRIRGIADIASTHDFQKLVADAIREDRREQANFVRVLRVIEYVGPREDVEEQIRRSLHGTRTFHHGGESEPMSITAVTIGEACEPGKSYKSTIRGTRSIRYS